MTKAKRMRELLNGDELIVSPGVFDGYSVRLVEQAGFKTASTSGAAVSNSRFGQPDVGIMGMLDNAQAVAHLARSVSIPLMADADTGYGNAVTVHHAVQYFEEAGVVGVNLEDQVWPKRCGHMEGKQVIAAEEMAKKLEAACNARRDDDFVIVARTDAIAIGGIEEAVRRAKLYEAAGADVLFPDAVRGEDDIKALRDAIDIPITVNMGFGIRSRPTTPLIPLPRLSELGVKRVSLPRMLPAAAMHAMRQALTLMKQSVETGETIDRPDLLFGIEDIMELMDYPKIRELETRYTTDA
ncbi:isocitrate lyase/PEP mutase family protein [Pelagibacterium sp.]|uniref:isocitrate lyase/PEP mutase family protein n=1 Tax=Pelagibacterium sp. TaxID=1967288 RepID=UPI003BAD749A